MYSLEGEEKDRERKTKSRFERPGPERRERVWLNIRRGEQFWQRLREQNNPKRRGSGGSSSGTHTEIHTQTGTYSVEPQYLRRYCQGRCSICICVLFFSLFLVLGTVEVWNRWMCRSTHVSAERRKGREKRKKMERKWKRKGTERKKVKGR